MFNSYQAGAGSQTKFAEQSDFFRLMECAGPVDVYFYQRGQEVARAEQVSGGYAENFAEDFDELVIHSATAQEIQFVCRYGNQVFYDKAPTGQVEVMNVAGAFTQATMTNIGAAAVDVLAANANRRYLFIQNNDAGLSMRVKLNGGAATAAQGVLLAPGASLELQGFVPTGKVSAICTTAGTLASVEVVEG